MKILRYIFCAASALFFVAAFCACEKDGAVLGGESVDYGTLEVADVYLYNNYPEAEILFEFSDPQYAEKPVFTFDSNLFVIEGSRVILRNLKSCALKMSLCPVSKQRWNIARSR